MSAIQLLDQIVDSHLGLLKVGEAPHYAHKTSALKVSNHDVPLRFDASTMISEMLSCIEVSYESTSSRITEGPSGENWRFEKQLYISEENQSAEKVLEKSIVAQTEGDWVNQVPTASGLYDPTSDKHRNVDLVHRLSENEYELFELKVNSGNPLQACVELLQYACLYLFARLHYPTFILESHELLQADILHFSVLAPRSYYSKEYTLGWFGRKVDAGLKKFVQSRGLELATDFQFKEFPGNFPQNFSLDQITLALAGIQKVIW